MANEQNVASYKPMHACVLIHMQLSQHTHTHMQSHMCRVRWVRMSKPVTEA